MDLEDVKVENIVEVINADLDSMLDLPKTPKTKKKKKQKKKAKVDEEIVPIEVPPKKEKSKIDPEFDSLFDA